MATSRLFRVEQSVLRPFTPGDALILIGISVIVYICVRLAFRAPVVIRGPSISLAPSALVLTLARTLPVGVAIGSNPRLARWL